MKQHRLEIFSTGHKFLEAPRWHQGKLWASDFFTKCVTVFAADGSFQPFVEVPGGPSGMGFLADGSLLVVSQADCKVLRVTGAGTIHEYADFSALAGGLGNDMYVRGDGHAYVGNFGFSLGEEDPKPTNLVHINAAGLVSAVSGDVVFPNGSGETADGRLLVAETFANRISEFTIAPDGSLVDHRVWADLGSDYHPDGIALDESGGVWFGNALTLGEDSGFYRVDDRGKITDKVPVDGAWAVACAFGGPNLSTLFMMCNQTTLEDFHEARSTAYVATVDVGYRGVPTIDNTASIQKSLRESSC